MMAHKGKLALAALCVVAGLALKAARYGDRQEASLADAVTRVEHFMQGQDWQSSGRVEHRAGGLYPYIVFRKPGCDKPVAVAFLGGNNESAELIRRDTGGDVVFVQNGELRAQPSGIKRQLAIVTAGFANLVNEQPLRRLPVLAVTPAPARELASCRGPTANAWLQLGERL